MRQAIAAFPHRVERHEGARETRDARSAVERARQHARTAGAALIDQHDVTRTRIAQHPDHERPGIDGVVSGPPAKKTIGSGSAARRRNDGDIEADPPAGALRSYVEAAAQRGAVDTRELAGAQPRRTRSGLGPGACGRQKKKKKKKRPPHHGLDYTL